jgi:signal transduction histidine kinase
LAEGECVSFDNLIDKNRDIFVNEDPGKIKQVFLNVLDNAIKYNKAGVRGRLEPEQT